MAMKYTIIITPKARRQLGDIAEPHRKRIADCIDGLGVNPFQWGVARLEGYVNLFRRRVGDYRIVFQVDKAVLKVFIIHIAHRREAYRRLGRG
jgi:mRNA interferase RelE/StbE